MLKEKGLTPKEPLEKLPLSALKPKRASDYLELKIEVTKEEVSAPVPHPSLNKKEETKTDEQKFRKKQERGQR